MPATLVVPFAGAVATAMPVAEPVIELVRSMAVAVLYATETPERFAVVGAACCCGPTKVNAPFDVTVPAGVVTAMLTAPAEPAGATAVICVALSTVKLVAAVLPKLTALAPVKLVPVTTTLVPPAVVPLFGVTAVIVGAAGKTEKLCCTCEAAAKLESPA